MLKQLIEFHFPKAIVDEISKRERIVESRNIEKIDVPPHVFGYRFYQRNVVDVNEKFYWGSKKNISPWTFYGKEYTVCEVKEQFPDETGLISRMEMGHYAHAVRGIYGDWSVLSDDDIVIPDTRNLEKPLPSSVLIDHLICNGCKQLRIRKNVDLDAVHNACVMCALCASTATLLDEHVTPYEVKAINRPDWCPRFA